MKGREGGGGVAQRETLLHVFRAKKTKVLQTDFIPDVLSVYSWTQLIQSPKGKRKLFELLTGARINEVKISCKAQGE